MAQDTWLPDATDFTDIEKREAFENLTVECPKCKGYGRWNLTLNAYGAGMHFQAHCGQCNGWGWVMPGPDVTCIHDWEETSRPDSHRSGWHDIECTKCGRKSGYDTSD